MLAVEAVQRLSRHKLFADLMVVERMTQIDIASDCTVSLEVQDIVGHSVNQNLSILAMVASYEQSHCFLA